MKQVITCLAIALLSSLQAQTTAFQWAKQTGDSGDDGAKANAVDTSGNVYTLGWFTGTVDFDPGPGTFSLTASVNKGIYISKLDPAGNFVWAKSFDGASTKAGISIHIDVSGNVLTTGWYKGAVDFDPGPGVFNLSPAASSTLETFVSKLDASGNFVWAKSLGNSDSYGGYSVRTDASGNVLVSGIFMNTVDFNPGSGVFTMTSNGYSDAFCVKLDAAGNFIWARQIGGQYYDYGFGVDADGSGNVYLVGGYNDVVDFDPGASTYTMSSVGPTAANDVFILKLSAAGNFIWAKSVGSDQADGPSTIAVSSGGDVYVAGIYESTIDIDPSSATTTLTSGGFGDFFVMKLDASGNFLWGKGIGGSGYDEANSMHLDALGNVYLCGSFRNTVDFDPGPGSFNLNAGNTSPAAFIMQLTPGGNLGWATNLVGNTYGNGISLDASYNVYVSGRFQNATDMDPGPGTATFTTPSGAPDAYTLKLGQSIVGIEDQAGTKLGISVFPNPTQTAAQVVFDNLGGNATVKVLTLSGSLLQEQHGLRGNLATINTSGLPAGIYMIEIRDGDRVAYKKLVKE